MTTQSNDKPPAPRPAKARTAAESLLYAGAAAAALVLLNLATCTSHRKLDLTEAGIYSLSPASKRLVKHLPEKLTIHAYFGNVPAEYADRQSYLDSLLAEYADASDGKVTYLRHAEDASERKESAERQKQLADEGIKKIQLITLAEDQQKQVPVYFHVQLQYLDKKELWSLETSRQFSLEGLEYEFTSRIRRLSGGRKVVGVTSGFGEPEQIQALEQPGVEVAGGVRLGLADIYEVRRVDWKTSPQALRDVDALIVNGPTEPVSELAKYELDQFVMRGKPAVLLIRGMKWQSTANQQQQMMNPGADSPYMGMPVDTGLDDLLAGWGFQVGHDVVLDGRAAVNGVVPIGNPPLVTKLLFPLVKNLDPGRDGLIPGMDALVMPYASTVKLVGPLAQDGGGFKVHALLRTSPYAIAKAETMLLTRQTQIDTKTAIKGPFMVGVAAEGPFASLWAGKPAPAGVAAEAAPDPQDVAIDDGVPDAGAPAAAAPPVVIAAAPATTRVVVIGGTAFAEDQTFGIMKMVQEPAYLNGFLAIHALVDWAVQDTDLTPLRAKQVLRPIEPLEPGKKLLVKYGNVAGVPLALVLFGVIYWRVRESRRRRVKL